MRDAIKGRPSAIACTALADFIDIGSIGIQYWIMRRYFMPHMGVQ